MSEVEGRYEHETGRVIVETFQSGGIAPAEVPGCWWRITARSPGDVMPGEAVENAAILEYLARIEIARLTIAADAPRPAAFLVNRHFTRKHGTDAYYGQVEPNP